MSKVRSPRQSQAYPQYDYVVAVLNEVALGNLEVAVDVSRAPKDALLLALGKALKVVAAAQREVFINTVLLEKSAVSMTRAAQTVREAGSKVNDGLAGVLFANVEMQQHLITASASTEELSANMQSIAGAAKQSNDNIDSIQSSVKELTNASTDIAQNTARATAISRDAMNNVTAAFQLVNDLTAAARDIDLVTATISEISDQTKLLALNATIESARAGEMGKGFAVVAKEVKDLASQTNTATKDIQSKIAVIHAVTKRTAESITSINTVMQSVNESITSIAAAAEEQSVTTHDISKNIVDATERIKEMTSNVGEGAAAIQDVSKTILGATNNSNQVVDVMHSLQEHGQAIDKHSIANYAQSLEVAGVSADLNRNARTFKISEQSRAAAEAAHPTLCRYTDAYDVLIERMNDDHKKIFDYCNSLHEKVRDQADKSAVVPLFKELAAFAREHFRREEEAMAKARYEGLADQQKAHHKLLATVDDIAARFDSESTVDLAAAVASLREWLVNHILVMDKKYGPVLVEAGVS